MKRATIVHLAIGLFVTPILVSFLALTPQHALARDGGYDAEPSERYSREELAQMLAPIALYSDTLLSQVLMASTYPIEVIEADRWVRQNPGLEGAVLDDALLAEDWDPSVKAICHFPSVLALMSERITETTEIGNAFLAQEGEVMDMVQELRARAYARGSLYTDSRQKVVIERETIIIHPANPRVIYVPYYDPLSIYGPWWYPAYPPWYWGPSSVRIGVGVAYWPGFHFSFAYGSWSYFDWSRRIIYIDVHKRPRYVRHRHWTQKPGRWHHAPHHRRGVAYRDRHTALKYGQPSPRYRDYGRGSRVIQERRATDRGNVGRGSERIRIDGGRRGDDRLRLETDRQREQQGRQGRQIRELVHRKPQKIDRGPRKDERAEHGRQVRVKTDKGQKEGGNDRQVRGQSGRDKKRQAIGSERQEGKFAAPVRQERTKYGRKKGTDLL